MNESYLCDCMEKMKEYPDKYFDLAVVDPPYGIGLQSMTFTKEGSRKKYGWSAAAKRDYDRTDAWDIKPTKDFFDELFRVSKKQVIWGFNHLCDMLPPTPSFICWDKRVNDAMTNSFADCELAWVSPGGGVGRIFRYCWNGMIQGDMANKEDRFHPTQKPIALYAWIYQRYAKPGDKILDTHLGSGSSRCAAWDVGLDFVGMEINEFYYQKQEERFERHIAQLNMFNMGW